MAYLLLPSRRIRQPQQPIGVDWGNPITVGLQFLLEPFNRLDITYRNVAGRVGNAVSNYTDATGQSLDLVNTRWGAFRGISTVYPNTEILLPTGALNAAFAASGQATVIGLLRQITQDPDGDFSGFLLKNSGGAAEHYPYTDGKVYCGPFSNVRWVNGITPPSAITDVHMWAATHRSGYQQAWFNGISVATGTNAETPTMANGRFATGFGGDDSIYLYLLSSPMEQGT